MSLVAIIVIAVVVAIAFGTLIGFLPRLRERRRIKARERDLDTRRERVVSEHREEAEARLTRAEEAERRAQIAEREARAERAEAQQNQEKARLHEAGLADHELIEDHEREEFAGTSAVEPEGAVTDGSAEREEPQPVRRQ